MLTRRILGATCRRRIVIKVEPSISAAFGWGILVIVIGYLACAEMTKRLVIATPRNRREQQADGLTRRLVTPPRIHS